MNYQVVRSRRKTAAIEVTREGAVIVRAPQRMPRADISAMVEQHAAWIEKKLAVQRARAAAYPPPDETELAALMARARTELPPLIAYYAAIMGVAPAEVSFGKARTRFGSCTGDNRLRFSCLLMRYPEAAIRYVVVHELAHIRHHDHSPAFYAEVARVLPDYKERAALLK